MLTPEGNRLLLISIQLIGTTAITLPTLFEGGRLLELKLKGFAAVAGPLYDTFFILIVLKLNQSLSELFHRLKWPSFGPLFLICFINHPNLQIRK